MASLLIRFGAVALTAVCVAAVSAAASQARDASRPTPSGLPVPRYVSLKFDEVNARAGPGDDYRLLWTYRRRGLPLQVIAETADWRRVCDPEGAVAWVHQRTVDTRRMVMRTQVQPLPLYRHPEIKGSPVAVMAGRSLARLDVCEAGWCRIAAGRVKGWTRVEELWGTRENAQCRPRLAASPR